MSKRIWTWCFLLALAGCTTKSAAPDASVGAGTAVLPRPPRPPADPNHAKMVARMQAPYHAQLVLPDMRVPLKQAPKLKGVPTPGPSPSGGSFPSQGGNADKFLQTNGSAVAWANITLQLAYNGGSTIDESGPGEGSGPVTIQAHSTTDSNELLQVLDHSGNVLFNVFDSTLVTDGTTFIKRLFLFGGDEIVSSGGFSPGDKDVMTYDAGAAKWYGLPPAIPTTRAISAGTGLSGGGDLSADRTISMPNTGPGAATYCGSGAYVDSTTLDAQGRVTALTCATPASAPDEIQWSPVDYCVAGLGTPVCSAGNFTNSMAFNIHKAATITGVRLYYPDTTSRSIKVSIWDDTGTRLATQTNTYNSVGVKTVTFGSSVALTTAHTYHQWFASMWETTGSCFIKFTTPNTSVASPVEAMPPFPFNAGPHLTYLESAYQAGDAVPIIGNAGGVEDYPIEPIFTVP